MSRWNLKAHADEIRQPFQSLQVGVTDRLWGICDIGTVSYKIGRVSHDGAEGHL
jgi:hypothetical protein